MTYTPLPTFSAIAASRELVRAAERAARAQNGRDGSTARVGGGS